MASFKTKVKKVIPPEEKNKEREEKIDL